MEYSKLIIKQYFVYYFGQLLRFIGKIISYSDMVLILFLEGIP